ncbi:MAG: PKD domain-containing protein [Candidatus Bipolaricaulia bacterium]
MRMRKIALILIGFILALALVLAPTGLILTHAYADPEGEETEIVVASVTARPEEEKTVAVAAFNVPEPGIASIQGALAFCPEVVQVQELVFSEKFNIEVKNIQTASVKFAATLTGDKEPIGEEVLLELRVKAVGQPGDECELSLSLDVLSDLNYRPIPHKITNGLFKIKAENQPPVADFSFAPLEPTTEDTVAFTDLSTDPDGRIVSWLWEFGDGATAEIQTPSHRFAEPGNYSVKLTVTDDEGATATKTQMVFVRPMVTEITVIVYPNPAKDRVTFRYYLPRGMKRATLFVFDLTGVLVFSQELDVTKIELTWDLKDRLGKPLPNGLYFFFIQGIDAQDRPQRSKIEKLVIQR